jgi:hypothetical protein
MAEIHLASKVIRAGFPDDSVTTQPRSGRICQGDRLKVGGLGARKLSRSGQDFSGRTSRDKKPWLCL